MKVHMYRFCWSRMFGFRGRWVSCNPLFGFVNPYEILDDPLGSFQNKTKYGISLTKKA